MLSRENELLAGRQKRHAGRARSPTDLDWIVMKCLEKDRNRRYEGATGLAMDVRRFLDGDAIEAAPPTWSYRFQKIVRRHRKSFVVAAAFALLLSAATVFSTWQAIRAESQKAEAIHQRAAAESISAWLEDLLVQSDAWGTSQGGERVSI